MKIITLFILSGLFLFLTGCDKEKRESEKGIVGEWLLIEEMYDPGDGSGTFHPVTSNKEVEFFANGTFEANGDMCQMTNQSGTMHTGTYDSSTETFSPSNCMSMAPMSYGYSLNGNTLILSYPCICGCQQMFIRL